MISIISYGVANLGSMVNMLRKIGVAFKLVETPREVLEAHRIILPGVGAFDHGMTELRNRGLVGPIRERAAAGVPLLGVCLGMQLLGSASEEGETEGLCLLKAKSRRLAPPTESRLKVPHMGWATLTPQRSHPLLNGLTSETRFYFVHSYHVVCAEAGDSLALARYGEPFTAMVQRGNIYGVQFHPEKSHRTGMTLLKNFATIT
jgi:glutamine amidotransferase